DQGVEPEHLQEREVPLYPLELEGEPEGGDQEKVAPDRTGIAGPVDRQEEGGGEVEGRSQEVGRELRRARADQTVGEQGRDQGAGVHPARERMAGRPAPPLPPGLEADEEERQREQPERGDARGPLDRRVGEAARERGG